MIVFTFSLKVFLYLQNCHGS